MIKEILGNSISYGNFNCVVVFERGHSEFFRLYKEINDMFIPDEVVSSAFSLDSSEMEEFDISIPFSDDALIRQVLFFKGTQQISLEYYKGKFMLGHFFKYSDTIFKDGNSIIDKYLKQEESIILVLGFELSLHLNIFNSSLEDNISDVSLHPITVIRKQDNICERKEYMHGDGQIYEQKNKIINSYLPSCS